MNYDLNEAQLGILKLYESFGRTELSCRDNAPEEKMSAKIDNLRQNLKKLGSIGFMGLAHAHEFGGSDEGFLSLAIAGEQIAKKCNSTYHAAVTSALGFGLFLKHFGGEGQTEKYLPGIIAGDLVGSYALSESESGSDILNIGTTAEKKGDSWIISGRKLYVTNAPIADAVIISAVTDKDAGEKGLTCFIINTDLAGVVISEPVHTMGMKEVPAAEVKLDRCEVSSGAILGEPGDGYKQIREIEKYTRFAMAVMSLGISSASMDLSNQYSKERKAFGRIINRYQEVSFKLADMMILSDLSRLMTFKAAWELDENMAGAEDMVNCAKVFASEAATDISNWSLQIHGASGYTAGNPVERFYRDAKFGEIAGGTSEVLRVNIAKPLLDKYRD